MRVNLLCLLVSLAGAVSALSTGQSNLIQLASSLGANTLVSYVQQAGLTDTLAHGGPFTIFAPSDDAFNQLPPDVLNALKQNVSLLKDVLKYHVVRGDILSSDLINDFVLPTLLPYRKIRVNMYQNNTIVMMTGSRVTAVDKMASNGIIHVIDHVMYNIPDHSILTYAASQPNLGQLVYNAIRANLQTTLQGGPFTVFAPVDSAWYDLPPNFLNTVFLSLNKSQELLEYHVVSGTYYSGGLVDGQKVPTVAGGNLTVQISGGQVLIDNAHVTHADISVTNGVIHVIDKVMVPAVLRNIT
ncbi:transforming growth factor-beta-induced protein ig-h3-like [Mizuhopecten yessoensis]|uniref:Transforming growth factor-beta-induced protein ig-h3 n=1 Tax=Mizuhopecten yessoensis TaxID=6573 RepID=A0A210PIK8_MIZYE|nr:transforming growth factor-beta-induced protein ig-h3-like [Mizuhopecten yessoensis]OWF36314.1 Transforming growth factor-beta-induced protein ig-h3 [Mizuhopecten yessoensis]